MADPIIEAIIKLLEQPWPIVSVKLDEVAARNPMHAEKIAALKAFLGTLYKALPNSAVEGFREVVALIQTGSGPVSHDPVDLA